MCARVGLWISTAEPIKIHSPWLIQQSFVLDCESCPTSVKFHHPTLEWFYKSCTDTVRGRWVGKQFVLQSVPRLPFPQLLCYTIHVILYIYSWIWSRAKSPRFHFFTCSLLLPWYIYTTDLNFLCNRNISNIFLSIWKFTEHLAQFSNIITRVLLCRQSVVCLKR